MWLRRVVNTLFPIVLGGWLLLAAVPRDKLHGEMQASHDRVVEAFRKLSLSQTWRMYAPDPARGHFFMELTAYDADGNARVLEDSYMAEHGWGTAWAWNRTRLDIWQHAVTRRIDTMNRNRTWYLRGVCVREARRGHDVARIEMNSVFRRIRSPEQVAEGKPLLGSPKRTKAQDGSCRVKIIKDMIAEDPGRSGRSGAGDD